MPHSRSIDIRVYYEDTDAGGVVYYANYLKFAERGRTELLRSLGFENTSLWSGHGVLFVVRRVVADYLKPARLDDLLRVDTSIGTIRNTSLTMLQTVSRDGETMCEMEVVLACVGRDFRPVRLPEEIRRAFERLTG